MPTGTLRIFKGLWKLEKSFRRAGPVSQGHLENQKQNGSETVETECKIAGEKKKKKKEKSGENVVEMGWRQTCWGLGPVKERGACVFLEILIKIPSPQLGLQVEKDVCFGD